MTDEQFNRQVDGMYFHQQGERAMMSSNLERAYLELEIDEKNLDVYSARADSDLSRSFIEREKIGQQRAILAEKRARLELRRLQEEIEQLKVEQAPVAEPVSRGATGVYIPAQRFEDLRLVCSSMGDQYLPGVPEHFVKQVRAWFELLNAAINHNGDQTSDELQECRRLLTDDIAKNTIRGQARKV